VLRAVIGPPACNSGGQRIEFVQQNNISNSI